MVTTDNGHYGIILETKASGEKKILYLEDKKGALTSFELVREVHEVNNCREKNELMFSYSSACQMSQEVSK